MEYTRLANKATKEDTKKVLKCEKSRCTKKDKVLYGYAKDGEEVYICTSCAKKINKKNK